MNRHILAILALLPLLPAHAAETHFYLVAGPVSPFNQPGLISQGLRPFATDFDGDGDIDVLATQSSFHNIVYWRNTGTPAAPSFMQTSAAFNAVTGMAGGALYAADVDGDSDRDLFVIRSNGSTQFYRNTGTAAAPVFATVTGAGNPFAGVTGLAAFNPASGDLDGDGDIDLVATDAGGEKLVLLRNTGTTAAPVFVREEFAPLTGIVADFYPGPALSDTDDDGDLDLFIGSGFGEVEERIRDYRNTGTSTAPVFTLDQTPIPYRSVGNDPSPAVSDFDADGFPDLLCGFSESSFVYQRGGPPVAPRFAEVTGAGHPVSSASTRYLHSSADLDGDGDADLACTSGPAPYLASLAFLRNTGTSAAPAWETWNGPSPAPALGAGSIVDLALANIDGGSATDLVVVTYTTSGEVLRYFRNTGTAAAPAFTERTGTNNPFNAISGYNNSPAFADLDNDGDPDLIAGKQYYQNTGSIAAPVFSLRTGAQSPLPDLSWIMLMIPELADCDGDGDYDLACVAGLANTSAAPLPLYFENTGSAVSPAFTLRTGADSPFAGFNGDNDLSDVHIGQWNNDTAPDLMLTTVGFSPGIRYFNGVKNSQLSYAEWTQFWFGTHPGSPPAVPEADPDGDGKQNLVEFAVGTPPVSTSKIPFTFTRTPAGLLQIAIDVRNDDPVLAALSASAEGSSTPGNLSGNFAPIVTDPAPGDGFALWTFTDQPPAGPNPRRFLRVRFRVN